MAAAASDLEASEILILDEAEEHGAGTSSVNDEVDDGI
jgi:hypothetical protein